MSPHDAAHFAVHPSVVFQLGESLITDSVQALIELVKNCYDADATYAKVVIDTRGTLEVPGALHAPSCGRIVVEDDGSGMDEATIRESWLVLSGREKHELKARRETTEGGRTPLGDKGLGRLGAQRLGNGIDVFTKRAGSAAWHFGFSWSDFASVEALENVSVHLEKAEDVRKNGTRVVISTLKDLQAWQGAESLKRLQHELSRMISPYEAIRSFTVFIEVDGQQLELVEISSRLRDIAPVQYSLKFDGEALEITGRARLDFFRPSSGKEGEQFALFVEGDEGKAFYGFLESEKRAKLIRLRKSPSRKWFVEFSRRRPLEDIDGVVRVREGAGLTMANPGPFVGEVDSFDLGPESFRHQGIFDRLKEFRNHVKDLSGIRVYRDGFAIRVDRDWLKLGAQWTSAGSYYGLKPDNTLGYIALTARGNMALEETTDREGFKDSPHYRNFYLLLEEFRDFTSEAQEYFGRAWPQFRDMRREKSAMVDSRKTMESISADLKARLSAATDRRKGLQQIRRRLDEAALSSREAALRMKAGRGGKDAERQLEATHDAMRGLSDETRQLLRDVEAHLGELESLKELGEVLEGRVVNLRRQMDEMYETVALGLTAEALSHEIFQIADGLARRAKALAAKLERSGDGDDAVLKFVETVRVAVMALRKQLSYLSPSLRYVREQREEILIPEFLKGLEEFYVERLARKRIALIVTQASAEPFTIKMNRGKLAQVVDNLILNSEYWLAEDIRAERIPGGEIHVEGARPFIRIWDTGRGIDPSVEPGLFEPFVSAKGRGVGRGLGLFIVKQLLDSEGCHIGVLPERNRHRRLYKFQLDMRGALHG